MTCATLGLTINGQTGALAWRAGGNGTSVRQLGLWDRIKVTSLLMNEPPGVVYALIRVSRGKQAQEDQARPQPVGGDSNSDKEKPPNKCPVALGVSWLTDQPCAVC